MRRSSKALVSLVLLTLVPLASADVPQLEVEPRNYTGVNGTIDANRESQAEYSFLNNGTEEIINVTTPDTEYLDFEKDKFDLDPGERKFFDATIFTRTPTQVEDNLSISYKYNDTSGSESEITFDRNSYPKIFFDFSSEWVRTSLSLTTYEDSFELQLDEVESSVFKMENIGSETAYSVEILTNEYVDVVDYSVMNLSNTSDNIVEIEYSVQRPDDEEEATEMTNRSYEPEITVRGANFPSKNFSSIIDVPFKEYDEIRTQEDLAQDLQNFVDFCRDNPDAPICTGQINVTEDDEENETKQPVNHYNLTEKERVALESLLNREIQQSKNYSVLLNRIELLKDRVEVQNSNTRENTDENLQNVTQALKDVAETQRRLAEEQEQENKQEQSQQQFGQLIALILLISGVTGGGIFVLIRKIRDIFNDETLDSGL